MHLGHAIMSFYAALIDLLGRCAPEMHVRAKGRGWGARPVLNLIPAVSFGPGLGNAGDTPLTKTAPDPLSMAPCPVRGPGSERGVVKAAVEMRRQAQG